MRGFPKTLSLNRLTPKKTKKRSPGPGPIRKIDWKPIAMKNLKNRKVVLHTDGARTYLLKVPGMIHDQAIHKAKKAQVNGKTVWIQPKYSKIVCHEIDGGKLYVKTGTQVIDRFWRHLREHLGSMQKKPGSARLRSRIRSAQFTYWYKGEDLWVKTGEMVESVRSM